MDELHASRNSDLKVDEKVPPIAYYGGKSNHSASSGMGRWIAGQLPYAFKSTYVETHGGLLGILLSRPKAKVEIVNDLNGRIVNLWRTIRDAKDDLVHAVVHSPHSERMYHESVQTIDEGTALERAVKTYVSIRDSIHHTDQPGTFGMNYTPKGARVSIKREIERIDYMCERLIDVQLSDQPAVKLLKRIKDIREAVIYVDPPYPSAVTANYTAVQHDFEETVDLLNQQSGRVAVSGYGDEWDALGWRKLERERRSLPVSAPSKSSSPRIESLWLNFAVDELLV